MKPGVLLLVSLLSLYGAAMLIFWQSLWRQKREAPLGTAVRFVLREGQTKKDQCMLPQRLQCIFCSHPDRPALPTSPSIQKQR